MYAERLPSGVWGVYMDDGRRIAIYNTEKAAKRHIVVLRKKGAAE
jgi:hypothetical protein